LPDRGRGLVSSGSLAYARAPDLLKAFRFAFRDVGEEVGYYRDLATGYHMLGSHEREAAERLELEDGHIP